jgi:glycosyltransferase involved in cell wall biosynthesis
MLGMTQAFIRAGWDVYLDPQVCSPPLTQEIADLLTKRLEAPFNLLVHHVDPGALSLEQHTARASEIRVAWSMWERSTLDNLHNHRTFKQRMNGIYHLLLAYDPVTYGAFEPFTKRSRKYSDLPVISQLQGGYWPDDHPYVKRDWSPPDRYFGFCMLGQLHERKDPFVAIEAFRELKEQFPEEFEPAELHLKTNIPSLPPQMEEWIPKLKIHYDVWPAPKVKEFYSKMHCLLAPSRGEGKNMPALEMMSSGGAVIATNWGGHTGWMSSEYAYPLSYTLSPSDGRYPNCLDARADKEHLKELMLHVFRNRGEAKRKGEIASQVIPRMMSWDTVVQSLVRRVIDNLPEEKTSKLQHMLAYLGKVEDK